MKNIIDVYEGLLRGMEDHLSMTDDDVKNMFTFGGHYGQIKHAYYVKDGGKLKEPKWLNKKVLTDLTKHLKATPDLQKLYNSNEISETVYMFYKWFENLNLSKFSPNGKEPDLQSNPIRNTVAKEITKYARELDIFTGAKANVVDVYLGIDWLDEKKLDVRAWIYSTDSKGSTNTKPNDWINILYYKTR